MTTKLPVCVFAWDGVVDSRALKPVEFCENCKLPKGHERHTLPAQSVEVTEAENRRYADRTEETE